MYGLFIDRWDEPHLVYQPVDQNACYPVICRSGEMIYQGDKPVTGKVAFHSPIDHALKSAVGEPVNSQEVPE